MNNNPDISIKSKSKRYVQEVDEDYFDLTKIFDNSSNNQKSLDQESIMLYDDEFNKGFSDQGLYDEEFSDELIDIYKL